MVIDDEKNITLVIQAMLEKAGFEAIVYNDSTKALEAMDGGEDVDVVVTDLYMPGRSGMDVLTHCQKNHAGLPVVVITAHGSVESAVAALKLGAFDFITKPFEQSELLNVVRKAVRTRRQGEKEPVAVLPQQQISSMIGASQLMQDVFKIIAKIAPSPSTVLVWGESGTGKELVAQEIHGNSLRAKKPFIKVNCSAIPATLIESELFGYERGAFTGAVSSKPGRFELAHEGTLFLDEVGEMPVEMQVKLLRALQEQEFERVGGINTTRVDVRIIAATNKDLEAEVKAGKFREDLFYRLNVVPIKLPPLRDRKDDIELLVNFFIQQFNTKLGKKITGIEPAAMEALKGFMWPGNIRQLENVIERMILMADGTVLLPSDLPEDIAPLVVAPDTAAGASPGDGSSASFKDIVRRNTQTVERGLIEKALEETGGNVTRAADKLGLSRKGLQIKIKELGIRRHGDPVE